jgi:predicted DNA-binding protein (UPF0251 family)
MRHPPRREPHQDLLRQAYLLTGESDEAYRLAYRAAGAGQFHGLRHDAGEALEFAKCELVRSFVAEPGAPRARPGDPAPVSSDVAVWQAVSRLSPRRRAAIVLRYDEGLTEEEAAARLGTSRQTVRADVDAGMLTLRTALPGVADPWNRVADALAAAGRGWSDYARPAPRQVAEVLAAPRPARSRSPEPVPVPTTGRHPLRPAVVAAAVAAVLLGAAVAVPRLTRDAPTPTPVAEAAVAAGQQTAPRGNRLSVPTRPAPKGLLDWPARGPRGADPALLAAAGRAWKAKAPAAEAPATGLAVLWAGPIEGRTVVVLQALDRSGRPRLAQVDGVSAAALKLQHAEPLHPTQVLSILPPSGPTGPVRVLVSPEGQVADGLLASNPMSGKPLQATPIGTDGLSPVLPSPPGAPTCSRVVLLGLDPATGTAGRDPQVLFSGVASADMLTPMAMEVEVGTAALAPSDAQPETTWFTDGAVLASKVPGKGTLTVAALGPRIAPRALSGTDRRVVSSRAYELRRGSTRYLGSVIAVGGKTVCASAYPAGTASGSTAWALRCPVPGEMMPGLVHVVGGSGVSSVDVDLAPTRSPAGQERHVGTSTRPGGVPDTDAFADLQVVPMGFPCGPGTLRAHHDAAVATVTLPVYLP